MEASNSKALPCSIWRMTSASAQHARIDSRDGAAARPSNAPSGERPSTASFAAFSRSPRGDGNLDGWEAQRRLVGGLTEGGREAGSNSAAPGIPTRRVAMSAPVIAEMGTRYLRGEAEVHTGRAKSTTVAPTM